MEDNPQKHLKPTQKAVVFNLNDNKNNNYFPSWFQGGDSEVTVISPGNHGNFFKKSRQLLQEVTALSGTFLGDFCNFSYGFLFVPALGTITSPMDFCHFS